MQHHKIFVTLIIGIFLELLLLGSTFGKPNSSLNAVTRSFFELVQSLHVSSSSSLCSGTGNNNNMKGVCMKTSACSALNGKDLGPCPMTGWTCCVRRVLATSSTKPVIITDRAILIQSSPSATTGTNAVFEFPKQAGICQVTLNFIDTRLQPPNAGVLDSGNCVVDAITVSDSPTLLQGSITVCGDMSGQHMHLSYRQGALADRPSDKIKISIQTASSSSKYSINALQIGCDDPNLAASFCLQEYVADSGQVRSFGYPRQLNNQFYHICTRGTQPGARSVTWKECSGVATPSFFVTGFPSTDGSQPPPQVGNIQCTSDFVYNTIGNPPTHHCGGSFPKLTTDSGIGHLSVNFDGNEIGSSAILRDLPPSVASCESVFFPGHKCRHPLRGDGRERTCICTLLPIYPILIDIPVLEDESCPNVRGYQCSKANNVNTLCNCIQDYDEADQANTGFCLQFTHNY